MTNKRMIGPEELARLLSEACDAESVFDAKQQDTQFARNAETDARNRAVAAWNTLYEALTSLAELARGRNSDAPLRQSKLWPLIDSDKRNRD